MISLIPPKRWSIETAIEETHAEVAPARTNGTGITGMSAAGLKKLPTPLPSIQKATMSPKITSVITGVCPAS